MKIEELREKLEKVLQGREPNIDNIIKQMKKSSE